MKSLIYAIIYLIILLTVSSCSRSRGVDIALNTADTLMPYRITCGVETGKGFLGSTTRCKVEIITCQGGGSGCNPSPCPVHPRPN